MKTSPTLLAAALLTTVISARAAAQPRMDGSLLATEPCPASRSIHRADADAPALQPGTAYRVVAKNKPDPTHYQVLIGGAPRWVAATCGRLGTDTATNAAPQPGPAPTTTATAGATGPATTVLALGWEPAFCRQHRDKAECADETATSPDATALSLHGLWPQPRGKAYCGVDPRFQQADRAHDWDALPEPQLSADTRQLLRNVMPGFRSGLERHEWIVHGTCFGGPADAYFTRAASLAQQVNASAVRALFVQATGASLSADQIRAAFDTAFGPGAGARVTVSCGGGGPRREITELVISLAGDVTGSAPLGQLMAAANPVPPGCPSGQVDRALH